MCQKPSQHSKVIDTDCTYILLLYFSLCCQVMHNILSMYLLLILVFLERQHSYMMISPVVIDVCFYRMLIIILHATLAMCMGLNYR